MKSILLAFLILFSATGISKENKTDRGITSSQDQVIVNVQYDLYFKQWSKKYSPMIDDRLLKVVCSKESHLNPNALSKEGALGLCQFMKGTWISISKENRLIERTGYFNPSQSILAASYYLAKLHQYFKHKPDSIRYTLASYNAGIGNVLKADRLCGNRGYEQMTSCLSKVTSKSSARTTNLYVNGIMNEL
jgi:membrane-bound lytic murein transglycosylase F